MVTLRPNQTARSIGHLLALVSAVLCSVVSSVAETLPRGHELTRALRQESIENSGAKEMASSRGTVPREVAAEEIAALLNGGEHVYLPIGHMASPAFAKALAARAHAGAFSPDLPVTIVGMSNTVSPKLFPRDGSVRVRSPFLSAAYRDVVSRGSGDFVPADYSALPDLYRHRQIPIDVAVHMVSPPDAQGYATIGTSVGEGLAAMQAAKLRVAEINPNVPRTFGASRVHLSQFDAVFKGDEKLKVIPEEAPTAAELAVAKQIAGLIPNGATVQFGIGSIANGVARALAQRGGKFRVWSELVSDGIVEMVRAGVVQGPVVYTFAMGSQAMLDALDGDKRYFSLPVDVVNNEQILSRLPSLVATNGALEGDVRGNGNGHKRGHETFTGIGGQLNFMSAAAHSPGGLAILGLPSTAEVHGQRITRIVPTLVGSVVTTPEHRVTHWVTEHGIAALRGKSEHERAVAMIGIADPDARPQLTEAVLKQQAAKTALEAGRYEKFLKRKASN